MFFSALKRAFALLHAMFTGCATHKSGLGDSRLGHRCGSFNLKFIARQPSEPFTRTQEPRASAFLDELKRWAIFTDAIFRPLASLFRRADDNRFHCYNIPHFWQKVKRQCGTQAESYSQWSVPIWRCGGPRGCQAKKPSREREGFGLEDMKLGPLYMVARGLYLLLRLRYRKGCLLVFANIVWLGHILFVEFYNNFIIWYFSLQFNDFIIWIYKHA